MDAEKNTTVPHTVLIALVHWLCIGIISVARPSLSIRPSDRTASLWLAHTKRLGCGARLPKIPGDLSQNVRVRFALGRSSAKALSEPVFCGDVAELVDAADLKSVDFGRPGSIPGVPTSGLGSNGFWAFYCRHALKFQERR